MNKCTLQGNDNSPNAEDASLTRSGNFAGRIEELEEAIMSLEAEKTRIENRSRANDLFFSGMANEIQSPIASAVEMADLLLAEPLEQKHLDIARDIKNTVQMVLTTVNDVLDLSKIKSGDLILEERHYDFISVLKTTRSTSFFQAKEKKLHLDFQIDPALPRYLFGDPGRLRQVLLNIIGNAIKYTNKGQISVNVNKDGKHVRFDISDSGVGMDADDLDALFSPFHDPFRDFKGGKKGTGLGLAISKSLVEMMGGSIIIDSIPGAGSRFHITLPARPGDPALVTAGEADSGGSRPVILIVDDKEKNLRLAANALATLGYASETASSGAEALRKLTEHDYSLVLMDYSMPEMNGAIAAEAARAIGKTTIPIILLAANADMEAVQQYSESGVTDVLAKPVEAEKLRRMLAKWIPNRQTAEKGATSILFMKGPGFGIVEMAGNIEGLNVEAGLGMVAGQYGVYEELLQLAAETLPSLVDNLALAAREGNASRLLVEINGLEESLHTLGMIALSEQARQCETQLKMNGMAACESSFQSLLRSLNIFINQLQGLFENSASSSSILYSDSIALAARLNKILHEMSLGNHVQVRKLIARTARRDYDDVPRTTLMEIKRLISAGEYRDAHKRIEAVLDTLRR